MNRIGVKLVLAACAVLVVEAGVRIYFNASHDAENFLANFIQTGRFHAISVAQAAEYGLLIRDPKELEKVADMLRTADDTDLLNVAFYDENGDLLAARQWRKDVAVAPHIKPTREITIGPCRAAGHEGHYEFRVPVQVSRAVMGATPAAPSSAVEIAMVVATRSRASLDARTAKNLTETILLSAGILVVFLGCMVLLARWTVAPIRPLVAGTERIAAGDLDTLVDVGRRKDEFHTLADSFNRMTGQLRRQRDQIVAYSHDMERQVGERTAELASANEQLNRMIATLEDRQRELEKANLQLGQAIEKANRMAVEAEQASAAKGDFLANMSHEIRTPMTAILGYTDLVSDPALGPSDRDNYLAVIRRNGEHLLELINDILDISKIEAGKFAMDVQPCSLPAVLADVASLMRARAEQRGVLLSVEYETAIPQAMHTDGARVRQTLVNLVGNAIKFTECGGVRVAASFLPAWRDGQPAVQIKVIDTGIGISEEKLAQLFQPFVQADASTSRKYGGTGLGLAISRHLAELLGGELAVESAVGKGSTFTLTLPTGNLEGVRMLQDPAEAAHGEAAGSCVPAINDHILAGMHVLLAEDGPDNQRLIRMILSKAGAEVELAADGREAVSKASAGSFDVVLMDMQMPGMDGYEATRTLRSQGYAVPILALTAHAMTSDREKCLAAGCTGHLTKPIDRRELIIAVAHHGGREVPCQGRAAPLPVALAGDSEVLMSQYAGDSDLAEVLDQFVAGLPRQIEAMSRAAHAGRREELQRLAHRLKGAGGSYGYPSLTEAARKLEEAARTGDVEGAGIALGRLIDLSRAVERGRVPEAVSKEVAS